MAGIDGIKVVAVGAAGDQPITAVGAPGGAPADGKNAPEGGPNGDDDRAPRNAEGGAGTQDVDGSRCSSGDVADDDSVSVGRVSMASNASSRASASLARLNRRASEAGAAVREGVGGRDTEREREGKEKGRAAACQSGRVWREGEGEN